jgi:hypothetical protein
MSAESVREFYRRQGEARERERIIELLEKWGEDNDRCYCCNNDVAAYDLTALIKGESSE